MLGPAAACGRPARGRSSAAPGPSWELRRSRRQSCA